MSEKKLYLPEELEPTRFWREGESYLTRRMLCARALELRAITGKKQFDFLWDNQDKIPDEWKEFWGLLVPDPTTGVVRVLNWHYVFEHWDHYEAEPHRSFSDFYRVLVPCFVGAWSLELLDF